MSSILLPILTVKMLQLELCCFGLFKIVKGSCYLKVASVSSKNSFVHSLRAAHYHSDVKTDPFWSQTKCKKKRQ